jgi:hypothetical protein
MLFGVASNPREGTHLKTEPEHLLSSLLWREKRLPSNTPSSDRPYQDFVWR